MRILINSLIFERILIDFLKRQKEIDSDRVLEVVATELANGLAVEGEGRRDMDSAGCLHRTLLACLSWWSLKLSPVFPIRGGRPHPCRPNLEGSRARAFQVEGTTPAKVLPHLAQLRSECGLQNGSTGPQSTTWILWTCCWFEVGFLPLLPLSNNCFVQVLYSLEVQIKFHLSVISLACWYLWVKAVKLSLLPGRGERMTRFISGSVPLTMWHMFWRFLQDLCPRRQFLSWQCSVSCSKRWWMDELPEVSWVLILIQWLATWISLAKLLTISRLGMSFHNPSE